MSPIPATPPQSTSYAQRLVALEGKWWKRVLDVQAPFRLHLRMLQPGHVLDVGCGIGRNLTHLRGDGVGVDMDPEAVAIARARGLRAFSADEFPGVPEAALDHYDSLLVAHVLEHMSPDDAAALVRSYAAYVRPGGQVILIVPQQAGFRSDPTHVTFVDFGGLERIAEAAGLRVTRRYSFPFPAVTGRVFLYNESVLLARKP